VPLRDPIFEPARVALETRRISNWLGANLHKLSYEQMKGPRESLYYLIDSRVKQLYAEEKRVLPKAHDPTLETLFAWSERLGVFGGSHVFNAVKKPEALPMAPAMVLPAGISLGLVKDLFAVQSELGWSVRFPYYFMIWNVNDFTATGGSRTQLLAVSTGAARDKSDLGHSQATLLLLYAPDTKIESVNDYWTKKLGIVATVKPEPLNVRGLQSRHVLDKPLRLHKEITTWSGPSGSFAVIYTGIDGTYQWNRPHFLDFVRAVKSAK
jgi:hypothetical protein